MRRDGVVFIIVVNGIPDAEIANALRKIIKRTLEGVRVWLDLAKASRFPDVYNWYMRLVPKKELPLEVLLKSIEDAGRQMLSCVPVRVIRYQGKSRKGEVAICPRCGEAYPTVQGDACLACRGKGYYERR